MRMLQEATRLARERYNLLLSLTIGELWFAENGSSFIPTWTLKLPDRT